MKSIALISKGGHFVVVFVSLKITAIKCNKICLRSSTSTKLVV